MYVCMLYVDSKFEKERKIEKKPINNNKNTMLSAYDASFQLRYLLPALIESVGEINALRVIHQDNCIDHIPRDDMNVLAKKIIIS